MHLRRSRVCRRHLREVGIHARIPATETDYVLIRFEIPYIEALAGGAYERTRAAPKARFRKFVPYGKIKQLVEIFGLETG